MSLEFQKPTRIRKQTERFQSNITSPKQLPLPSKTENEVAGEMPS